MSTVSNQNNPRFSPFRSWICLIGLIIGIGSLFSFLLLLAMGAMASSANPYLGILTFVVSPSFLVLGMLVFGLGWLLERRRLVKTAAGGSQPFLSLDFSRAHDRKAFLIFLIGTAVFILFSAVGSYHTFHFVESVTFCGQICHPAMKPEYTTYLMSPHARIGCVECHVGSGAASFVKAKLNGVRQLKETLLGSYHRPIPAPQAMRPAQETCEQCHWPQKYVGNVEKSYSRYLSDETNTLISLRLLLKVGGGDPTHGPVGGIHWHMNLGNKVEYITTNEQRQVIPWVRFTDAKGQVTEYRSANFKEDPNKYPIRRMDCMDCHNRPAHQYRNPSDSVDVAMSLGRLDATMPLLKSNLVAVLSLTNATTQAEGMALIAKSLKAAYPQDKRADAVIAETQTIYSESVFPEMRASWRAYPDNIGHKNWPGCFRCHDGAHKSSDGQRKISASDCNSCHLILGQNRGAQAKQMKAEGVVFEHPDSVSDGKDPNCTDCHANL